VRFLDEARFLEDARFLEEARFLPRFLVAPPSRVLEILGDLERDGVRLRLLGERAVRRDVDAFLPLFGALDFPFGLPATILNFN
jgi:hypothetical protein